MNWIKNVKNLSRLKLDWIGVVFAITGILLNSQKIIWCWPCFMLSNIFLGLHFGPKKEKAYMVLLVTYFCLNVFAWVQWAIK